MTEIQFMRKLRFLKLQEKFTKVSQEAQSVIDSAQMDDILQLELTFMNPINVTNAKIVKEEEFTELAF